MESFLSLLCFMGGPCDDYLVDIIGKLPPEVANMVLRNLDPASLLSAALVNKRWYALIRSDRILRERVLSQMKKQKKMRSRALKFNCRILRGGASSKPFEERNERFKVEMPKIASAVLEPPPKKRSMPEIMRADGDDWNAYKSKSGALNKLPEGKEEASTQPSKKRKLLQWSRQRMLRV